MAERETHGGTEITTPLSGVIEMEEEKRRRWLLTILYLNPVTGKDDTGNLVDPKGLEPLTSAM